MPADDAPHPIAAAGVLPFMADEIAILRAQMEAAAAALDFETARRLRDRIALLRGGASVDEAAAADTAGLARQQPGHMGLGTSRQRVAPPEGWTPPRKPDPMTEGRRGRRRVTRPSQAG